MTCVEQCSHVYDFLRHVKGVPRDLWKRSFPFQCVLCGFYPFHVSCDGNRKCCVRVSGKQVRNFKRRRDGAAVDMDASGSAIFADAFTSARTQTTPARQDCSMLRKGAYAYLQRFLRRRCVISRVARYPRSFWTLGLYTAPYISFLSRHSGQYTFPNPKVDIQAVLRSDQFSRDVEKFKGTCPHLK